MRLLLDVHIATSLSRVLQERGDDVVRAALSFPTSSDEALLAFAVSEDRIIVTQDSDFSDLIYAHGKPPPPAIIYLRCEPDQPDLVSRVIEVLETDLLIGHMAVIAPAAVRFRPLPDKSESDG